MRVESRQADSSEDRSTGGGRQLEGYSAAVPDAPPPLLAGYPKAARLRREKDFVPVRTRGRRHVGVEAVVRSVANDLGFARLGVSSPRRYGNAVKRNRFRRLVRAAFRALRSRLPARDWLVEPRPGLKDPTLVGIAADIEAAAERARA